MKKVLLFFASSFTCVCLAGIAGQFLPDVLGFLLGFFFGLTGVACFVSSIAFFISWGNKNGHWNSENWS